MYRVSQNNVHKNTLKYEYQERVLLGTNGVFLIPGSLRFVLQGIENI
jgi:hypothetical protein